ncbi:MAG TPA: type II secretion system protein GspC [Desulfobacteraceae bacterium]|nr:type II secretion system protein GspC [Desulfobacteraceae bacterium]HPJ66898.1 type II secretion system protein GspC [Desulfobacteraceae bacterium]HPQ27643.1 type II secretion system protein GspC [Desulfobacteraceae bacterium]
MARVYFIIFNLAALFAAVYTSVDIFYRVVLSRLNCPAETENVVINQDSRTGLYSKILLSDFQVITDRNLFGSLSVATKNTQPEDIEELEPTSLKIKLLGTVTGDPELSFSVIEETDKKKQGLYRVGDSIQDAVVKIILRGKIVLRVGNKDEILIMEEPVSSITAGRNGVSSGGKEPDSIITVSQAELQDSLKNINRLMMQVRIRPYFKDGKANGLAVSRIRADSIFSRLGLKNGDIIQGINGKPITSPDDVLNLYNSLKSGSTISLQMDRKGETKLLEYKFN